MATLIQRWDNIQKQVMHQQASQLTPGQQALIQLAQQFTVQASEEVQLQLKASNWRDIHAIITNVGVMVNARIVCCSLLKWLIYHRKFVDDPLALFNSLAQFYLQDNQQGTGLAKAQQIVEVVLEVIPSNYMTETQKQLLIQQLIKLLHTSPNKCHRIFTLIKFILECSEVENINNEVLAGQILLFLQQSLSSTLARQQKLSICKECMKLLDHLLQLVNDNDEIDSNVVEQFLCNSSLARQLLQEIIKDSSNNVQIITKQREVNELKLLCLQLYSRIWLYYLQEPMFRLCLSSLLTKPDQLVDQGGQIMDRIVVMLERSINQEAYYHYLHNNIQHIFIALVSMLAPKQSYLELADSNPEQFVDILYDFCMEQQRQILQVRVGSLISSFCMYIDGFMSFVGSMCIVIIKRFNNTISQIPGADEYIKIIDKMWIGTQQEKVAACIMVLCAISDQLERRQDLSRPLRAELVSMNASFNITTCKLPPYLICRFMFLYSFNAYPKCLDIFLPYKTVLPVYQSQLQSCYKIMQRYYNKYPQCKQYIDQIGPVVIMSDHLTSLLQTTIMTGELNLEVQYKILEKLVGWLDDGIKARNYVVCNKMSNLITILLDRMDVKDYAHTEEAVFAYLQPFFRFISKSEGRQCEEFVIQIAIAFVKRFPSLQNSKQRLMMLIQMGFKVVQRNNGVLNNCLDLFFEITKYSSVDLVRSYVQIYLGCLESQEREIDQWQCYYGLETCMLRICELSGAAPTINVPTILEKLSRYTSSILRLKVIMFLFSLILINPKSTQHYQQYLRDINLVIKIPPYENKPYLLYLLTLAPHLDQTPQQSLSILRLILHLLHEQKTIHKKIQKYEQQVYCDQMQQNHELAIDSYNVSRKLLHPLLLKNMDIYNQFRKCWIAYQNKEYVMSQLSEEEGKLVLELCTRTTINSKVRKIYKVKNQAMEEESEMR